jgi:hypothetical protein
MSTGTAGMKADPAVRPFHVDLAEEAVADLRRRIAAWHHRAAYQSRRTRRNRAGRIRCGDPVAFATYHRGYGVIQGSRPQTIGYNLADTPVGLAAWLLDHDATTYEHLAQLFAMPRLGMNAFPRKRLVKTCTSCSG